MKNIPYFCAIQNHRKMKKAMLLLLTGLSLLIQAQTVEVSGLQTGIWEADTIRVMSNIKVIDSLQIAAGTTVLFDNFYHITVGEGSWIKASGTATDSILFTVTDTTGFHIFNTGRGGWNGIQLNQASRSVFDYCRFQYGKAALDDDQDGGAICIRDCDEVTISHSTFFCNFSREHGGALNAEGSKVTINTCSVLNNLTFSHVDTIYYMYGGGMRFLSCEVDITETNFRNNIGETAIGGALCLEDCATMIDRCRFEHNFGINGAGLYLLRSNDLPCSISNSLFANNISRHFGGGLAIADASPLVSNLTVVNNHSVGVNCGGIFFYQHSSPVVRNCIVYGNTNEAPLEEPVQMWTWTYDGFVPEFHNCLVQFGFEQISNNDVIEVYESCLDENPLFVDADNGNFRLDAKSPCIDAGCMVENEGYDLDGNQRVYGNSIDIGAYEYSQTGVDEAVQEKAHLRIVGNPITASSFAEIELENNCDLWAKVYSVDGKMLVDKYLGYFSKGTKRIEAGTLFLPLSEGIYILVIQCNERTFTAKVIR